MNFSVRVFLLATPVLMSAAYSPPVVFNTKSTNADGIDVCAWGNVHILPFRTFNQPEKCRELYCGQDFSITISSCITDPSGKCQWFEANTTQEYPDCCGIRLCT